MSFGRQIVVFEHCAPPPPRFRGCCGMARDKSEIERARTSTGCPRTYIFKRTRATSGLRSRATKYYDVGPPQRARGCTNTRTRSMMYKYKYIHIPIHVYRHYRPDDRRVPHTGKDDSRKGRERIFAIGVPCVRANNDAGEDLRRTVRFIMCV